MTKSKTHSCNGLADQKLSLKFAPIIEKSRGKIIVESKCGSGDSYVDRT